MPNQGLGKSVLELIVDAAGFIAGLDEAEKKAAGFPKTVKAAGKELDDLGKAAQQFGAGLTASVTLPLLAVGAALTGLAVNAAKTGDEIAKGARAVGIGAEAYQELHYAIEQITDVTSEELDKAFANLTAVIGEAAAGGKKAETALRGLGFSQKEIASGAIATEVAFGRFIQKLDQAKSPAQAVAVAGDLIGDKLGKRLAGQLQGSGAEVDRLRARFKDLELGMSGDALNASERFMDQLDELQRQFGALGREIGAELLPILMDDLIPFIQDTGIPILRSLGELIASLIGWFGDLPRPIQLTAVGLVALAAALGPVILSLGVVASGLGSMMTAFAGSTIATNTFTAAVTRLGLALRALGPVAIATAGAVAAWELYRWTRDVVSAATGVQTFEQQMVAAGHEAMSFGERLQALALKMYLVSQGSVISDDAIDAMVMARRTLEGVSGAADRAGQAKANLAKQAEDLALRIANLRASGATGAEVLEQLGGSAASLTNLAKQLGVDLSTIPPEILALAAAARGAVPPVGQLSDEMAKLKASLFGQDVIKTATDLVTALGGVANISQLTAEQKARLHKAMSDVLEVYKALGKTAPAVMRQIHAATVDVAALSKSFADSIAKDTRAFIKDLPGQVAIVEDAVRRLPFVFADLRKPLPPGMIENFNAALKASIVDMNTFLGQLGMVRVDLGKPPKGPSIFDRIVVDLKKAMQQLPQVIVGAFQGGGNPGKAIGGFLGGALTEEIGKSVGSKIGGTLGATIGSAIPVLGTLLGGLAGDLIGKGIGALVGALKGKGAKANDVRDAIKEALGGDAAGRGLEKMIRDAMLSAGLGSALANALHDAQKRFGSSGDPEAVKRAGEDIARILEQIATQQAKVAAGFDRLGGALATFGGVAPRSLRPLVEEILKLNGLTDAQRSLLGDMLAAPEWQQVEATAQRLGISFEHLGDRFRKAKLTEELVALGRDLEFLEDAGADMDGVLTELAKKMSGFVNEALASGVALPQTLEPYIRRLIELGLLVDPNGEIRTGIEGIDFAEIPDEPLLELKGILEEIRDLLAQALPRAAEAGAEGIRRAFRGPFGPDIRVPDMEAAPSFDIGTGGTYLPRSMYARVHANEAITPRAEVPNLASDIGAILGERLAGVNPNITVQVFVGERELDDLVYESFYRKHENNDGGGASVSPLSRHAALNRRVGS